MKKVIVKFFILRYIGYICKINQIKNIKSNRIRIVLKVKGIRQTWLSEKLGKSFSTVNSYVCNHSQPNLTTLLEISKLLSVDKPISFPHGEILGGYPFC